MSAAWQPTVAFGRAATVAGVLIAIALVWRRPDVLVIATAFAVITAWSAVTRPRAAPTIDERLGRSTLREGEASRWRAIARGDVNLDAVVAVVDDARWIGRDPEAIAVRATRGGDATRADVTIGLRSLRWGVRQLPPVRLITVSPWAAFARRHETPRHTLTTLPLPAVFDANAAMRPSDGLIGQHRSRHVGEGNEFAAVRPFQPGDRLRRINWVRTVRTGDVQVNATWADRDVHLALVVDATDDYGLSGGVDGTASSLDLTVRAAGALAEHYASRGERVSLHTFGTPIARRVPPATGRRQVRRILDALARLSTDSERTGFRTPPHTDRAAGGQLIVMLSALIAPEALDHAVALGRRGLPVIVVDTLPLDVAIGDDPHTALAWRIRLLERRRELRLVRAAGIAVISWSGPGSLDGVIRDISRRSVRTQGR